MRTILKLKSKNKNEAIDALEKAFEHLKENVEDDEVDTFWNFLAGLLKFLISFIIIGPLIAILLIGIGIGALF